jgi:signal transduction histidine kinase
MSTGAGSLLARVKDVLPGGGSLPDEMWERRHRAILIVLWVHALAIAVFAALSGAPVLHDIAEGGVVALIAVLATFARGSRSLRAALAAAGLLTSSAMLVHLSGGLIEMHFHFFVVIGLLTLYMEWIPYLLAIGYVVVHHGIGGWVNPEVIYNHPAAIDNQWLWAAIHGGFVLAASAASVVAWRLNEHSREQTEQLQLKLHDEQIRQRQALEINDNVVQGLTVAKYALDAGDQAHAHEAVQKTLGAARHIVTELLGNEDEELDLGPGDLIRLEPASVVLPQRE